MQITSNLSKIHIWFYQGLIGLMIIGVIASSDASQHKRTNIRNVTISGMELNIPRNFLIGSSGSDREEITDALLIGFTYPEIKGGMGNGYDFIQVFAKDIREYFARKKVTHTQYIYDQYWDDFLDIDKDEGYIGIYKIEYRDFNQDLQRKHYRIKDYGTLYDIDKFIISWRKEGELSKKKEVVLRKELEETNKKFRKQLKEKLRPHKKHIYTNDDPESPEEFVICDSRKRKTRSFCYSVFFYKDLPIKVHFPRKYLKKYDDIKEKTLQLFNKWEDKTYAN